MAKYDKMMVCPTCGMRDLNILDYASLLVLKPHVGLFTMRCPNCQTKASTIHPIPTALEPAIIEAADKLNAGMGRNLSR